MKSCKKVLLTLFATIAVLALVPASAFAATATTTFSVTATVQATCLVSANTLAFGTYSGVQLDGTTTVGVTCTNTTPYTVGLDAGTFTGATVTTRRMTGPAAAPLSYSLFSDSGRTTNWGNTAGSWVSGTGNGSSQTLNVYGRIAAAQYATPGAYTDTITVTVTY